VSLYRVSPSKVSTWLNCPRRFRYQYVDKVKAPGNWAHLSMGNSIHDALRDWYDLPPQQRTPESAAELLRRDWRPQGFRDAEQSEQWRESAAQMVAAYAAGCDPELQPFGSERTLAARTETLSISGRVDRLDPVDGDDRRLVVVDYKTGKTVPTVDDARGSMALALYAITVQQTLRRECVAVELHHVPSGVIVRWEHSPEALDRHLRRVEQIASEMRGAEDALAARGDADALFPCETSRLCGWCDYRSMCAAGQAASAEQERWAGLPSAHGAAPEDGPDPDAAFGL